jgi:peroxiredoxin
MRRVGWKGVNLRAWSPMLVALSLLYSSTGSATQTDLDQRIVGHKVPDVNLPTSSGASISSNAYHGKWLVVEFFASWCEACLRELPTDVKLAKIFASKVTFLAIDERERSSVADKIIQRYHPTFQIALDQLDSKTSNVGSIDERRRALFYGPTGPFGVFAESVGVTIVPWHLLVDPTGKIRAVWAASDARLNKTESVLHAFGLVTNNKRLQGR